MFWNVEDIYIFSVLTVCLVGCGESRQSEAFKNYKITCPEGSEVQIQRWGGVGENGWLKNCLKRHGTYTAWNGSTKKIEGEYVEGIKEGIWKIWDENGKLFKNITYKNGKEVKVEEFKNDT